MKSSKKNISLAFQGVLPCTTFQSISGVAAKDNVLERERVGGHAPGAQEDGWGMPRSLMNCDNEIRPV
ncbi:hypothetical protein TNCV_3107761 [Trichonephila clavipes]|uniref:Uncharacterized protein n=1 Tax=Trichonephila clavipes TaxID=2585209 RepID=A0A8X6V5Z5_TRICX|nr:hypothetical protein TNCV_3107761 [Trichonephila clavipes]